MCHSINKCQTNLWFLLLRHISNGLSSAGKISDNRERPVKEPVSSSINYARVLSNQRIHSVNARGRWTNTCRLAIGAGREADLFSKLVCLISPAWCWKAEHASVVFQMQGIANHLIAGETGLCKLNSPGFLAIFSSEGGQRGTGLAKGLCP